VPAASRKDGRDLLGDVKIDHGDLQVQDRLGCQARRGRRTQMRSTAATSQSASAASSRQSLPLVALPTLAVE